MQTGAALFCLILWAGLSTAAEPLERSFWLHASLGLFTQHHYFGARYPETPAPSHDEVRNAARLLTQTWAANRLYLIYHRELPPEMARQLFTWWKEACDPGVEVIPALVLHMYDKEKSAVFSPAELDDLTTFFRTRINASHAAVYDIAPNRKGGKPQATLAKAFPQGLIRLGIQPGEALDPPFVSAVQDTWSGMCHGTDNERDWLKPGFGAATLRQWVLDRNAAAKPVAWDLVAVAWDYRTTERGGYPGYDDAEKNMPLPAGRNTRAFKLIRDAAKPEALAGFSSDLYILHENSRSQTHDGRENSFYQCLKRGEDYHGYYSVPFQEITALYRSLRKP